MQNEAKRFDYQHIWVINDGSILLTLISMIRWKWLSSNSFSAQSISPPPCALPACWTWFSAIQLLPSRPAMSAATVLSHGISVECLSGPLCLIAVVNWLTTSSSSAYAVVRVVEEVSDSGASTHCAYQIDEVRVWPTFIELLPSLEATWSGHNSKMAETKNQMNI